jgi:glucose/arabinose dehydrogenase
MCRNTILISLFAVILIVACGSSQKADNADSELSGNMQVSQVALDIRPINDYELPAPFATEHVRNHSQVVPRPEGAAISVPLGFTVQEYASDFKRPRFMLLGPSNEVLISDSDDDGAVYVLQDINGDGVSDKRHLLVDGMYRPFGIAFWQDHVYIAGTVEVKRWKYDAATMTVSGEGETIVSWPEFKKGHWTRTVLFNPEGTRMIVTIGSGSNVNAGEDPRRAAINMYDPDGSNHEILAEGLRNVIGLDFYPGTDQLWAAIQERDALGDGLVPDYFTRIFRGDFFGWPYAYTGPHEDPRREGERPDLVQKTRYPDIVLPAHCAVLDLEFYTGAMFPDKYHGGVFLAYHGSWNRSKRLGYSVNFIPFENGMPTGAPVEFLGGFMESPDSKIVWGRPVGVLQLQDGSLLVSDDGGDKVWRVSYPQQ